MSDPSGILREPWPSVARQREGVSFAVWIFLGTEVLFFGGMFLSYTVYRTLFPMAFKIASHETDIWYGTINTALLLTSSLTMTIALHASVLGRRRLLLFCLLTTAALGLAFLSVKGLEYAEDIRKHLLPGPSFSLEPAATRLFFGLYWVMTGIHAIHLAIGIVITGFFASLLSRRLIAPQSTAIEGTSLYWHFVDSIWIVLYALIYLPGRG